jgi:DNA-binding transcriptional MerR regulator
MKNIFSIGEVARDVGVPVFRIKYAITNGRIEAPKERFGSMRVFTGKDVQRIRKFFKNSNPSTSKKMKGTGSGEKDA